MDFSGMTGMSPGKKTRRGGRSKGTALSTHLSNLNKAMHAGDHTTAKTHALSLANALHRGTSTANLDEVDVPGTAEEPDPPQQAQPSGLSRLASALKSRRV